ncbi:hypothetical protein BAE44_0011225, partial [Dichanthelium oligosanthes]
LPPLYFVRTPPFPPPSYARPVQQHRDRHGARRARGGGGAGTVIGRGGRCRGRAGARGRFVGAGGRTGSSQCRRPWRRVVGERRERGRHREPRRYRAAIARSMPPPSTSCRSEAGRGSTRNTSTVMLEQNFHSWLKLMVTHQSSNLTNKRVSWIYLTERT